MSEMRSAPAEIVEQAAECLISASVDNGGSFTCAEADAIADLLKALGCSEEADGFLDNHAEGDDSDNSHYDRAVRDEPGDD